ncbi:YaaC family protein [Rhizobium ruizarguesonis]
MESRTWQKLMSLESRDVVSQWFTRLHHRDLNARRAKEITAAAKQAREFFKSSSESAYAVRPLLTFYGVASLSRALTLLFRKDGGEEGLTRGHGLETVSWADTLSGELGQALSKIGNLTVRTTRGLFEDLIVATDNCITMHVRSAGVDWSINYDVPPPGQELRLSDLLDRLPDIADQHQHLQRKTLYARVAPDMTFDDANGVSMTITSGNHEPFRSEFTSAGYAVAKSGRQIVLIASAAVFNEHVPQFVHSYVHKAFGSIPDLCVASELAPKLRYSQIAFTYVISYQLGMLARYYPTHWTSLMAGDKGDSLWPSINAAHHYIETTLPQLVLELIDDRLAKSDRAMPAAQ